MCHEEIGRVGRVGRVERGCYDDPTRKLLPWNSSYIPDDVTFDSAELVEGVEAGGVVDVVRVESDAEEVAVGADGRRAKVVGRAAVALHLAVRQMHVEVGKLDVVTLRCFVAAACAAVTHSHSARQLLDTTIISN